MAIKEEYQVEAYALEKFYAGLESLGIECSQEKINQFLKFYEMLIEKIK